MTTAIKPIELSPARNGGEKKDIAVSISPPKFKTVSFLITGTAPYVQCRFSEKAKNNMRGKHAAGSQGNKVIKKEPKDFELLFKQSQHKCDGWNGIPASAFRAAMIDACRLVGFKMTLAKLSIFVEGDGLCDYDQIPLVKLLNTQPEKIESIAWNETGVPDIRVRALFPIGWQAEPRIKFDLDQFSVEDITNLLMRVGQQVGIGEGRPNSKKSFGMGWGHFELSRR
jgi:hypothetical protein